jgi:hypothetical protein
MVIFLACYRAILMVVITGAVCACSSTHSYTNTTPENLVITPYVRKRSAQLHVHLVDNACNITYQGTVELNSPKVKIGLPNNKLSYLSFHFSDVSLLTGGSSTTYGIYITPRTGYQYDATATYADAMYNATIHEQDMRNGLRTLIAGTAPKVCATRH